MNDMTSFYGGRQGASFIIKRSFDLIENPTNLNKTAIYGVYEENGQHYIITASENSGDIGRHSDTDIITGGAIEVPNYPDDRANDDGATVTLASGIKYILEKNSSNYNWNVVTINNVDKPLKWMRFELDGGEYNFIEAGTGDISQGLLELSPCEVMMDYFKKGGETLSEVNYGEYVIIDTVTNLHDKQHSDNGKVFRRTMDSDNPAEYIGQFNGPAGEIPPIKFGSISQYPDESINNVNTFSFNLYEGLVPGYSKNIIGEEEFNDSVTYTYVPIMDGEGNVLEYRLGFQIPFYVPTFGGNIVEQYDLESIDSVMKDDDGSHPFYSHYTLNIPKGVKGDSITKGEIVPTTIMEGTNVYTNSTCEDASLYGTLSENYLMDEYFVLNNFDKDNTIQLTGGVNVLHTGSTSSELYISALYVKAYNLHSQDFSKTIFRVIETSYEETKEGTSVGKNAGVINDIREVDINDDGNMVVRFSNSSDDKIIPNGPVKWITHMENDGKNLIAYYNFGDAEDLGRIKGDSGSIVIGGKFDSTTELTAAPETLFGDSDKKGYGAIIPSEDDGYDVYLYNYETNNLGWYKIGFLASDIYVSKDDPYIKNHLSLGREENSTIGENSVVLSTQTGVELCYLTETKWYDPTVSGYTPYNFKDKNGNSCNLITWYGEAYLFLTSFTGSQATFSFPSSINFDDDVKTNNIIFDNIKISSNGRLDETEYSPRIVTNKSNIYFKVTPGTYPITTINSIKQFTVLGNWEDEDGNSIATPSDVNKGILYSLRGPWHGTKGIYLYRNTGDPSKATERASFAQGTGLIANQKNQHVIGKYNKTSLNAAFIIGNGSGTEDSNRSNAFEVDWEGNVTCKSIATSNANPSLLSLIYPVGSIYMNGKYDTNPSTLLGFGTWSRLSGRFLIGSGSIVEDGKTTSYTIGKTGGNKYRTLTTDNLPSHKHSISTTVGTAGNHIHTINNYGLKSEITLGAELVGGEDSKAKFTQNFYTWSADSSGKEIVTLKNSKYTGRVANSSSYTSSYAKFTNSTMVLDASHKHTMVAAGNHTHTITASIGNTGGNTAFEIIPPYKVVSMWMREA